MCPKQDRKATSTKVKITAAVWKVTSTPDMRLSSTQAETRLIMDSIRPFVAAAASPRGWMSSISRWAVSPSWASRMPTLAGSTPNSRESIPAVTLGSVERTSTLMPLSSRRCSSFFFRRSAV